IVQENRSFDSYFGTYPGADGIPMQNGAPSVCLPGPGGCYAPYHDPNDVNAGGPHNAQAAVGSIDGGRMDGFITVDWVNPIAPICANIPSDPRCSGSPPRTYDVMGY